MPANKRGWFHDDQSLAPVKQASEARKNEPVRYICGIGLLLTFLKERQLLAQEQILCGQRCTSTEERGEKTRAATNDNLYSKNQLAKLPGEASHVVIVSQLSD